MFAKDEEVTDMDELNKEVVDAESDIDEDTDEDDEEIVEETEEEE